MSCPSFTWQDVAIIAIACTYFAFIVVGLAWVNRR